MNGPMTLHLLTTTVAAIVFWRSFTALNIINRATCHAVRVAYIYLGGAAAVLVVAPWWPNNDIGAWVYLIFAAAVAFFLLVDRRRPRPKTPPQ